MDQQVKLRIFTDQAEVTGLFPKALMSYPGLLGTCKHTVHINLCRNTQIHIFFLKKIFICLFGK